MPTLAPNVAEGEDEDKKLLSMNEDELWDAAWKETWLALSAQVEEEGKGEVDEKKAFEVAQALWGKWMLRRKKLESEGSPDEKPSLPVNEELVSPKVRTGAGLLGLQSPALTGMSGLRAEAPEFTPVVTGERTMFNSFFSPDLLEGAMSQNPSSFTVNPNLSSLLNISSISTDPARTPSPGQTARIPPPNTGKKGLLGDGAEYFRLEPSAAEAVLQTSMEQELKNENTTQGWLPTGFSWVDPMEDETPPPPLYFEHQLPFARSFTKCKSGDTKNGLAKAVRLDNVSDSASVFHLKDMAGQFGTLLEFFVMGLARKSNACRLYLVYETEASAAAAKKAWHAKTHALSAGAMQAEVGRLETKSKNARDRRERRRVQSRNGGFEDEDVNWSAANMWAASAIGAMPSYPGPTFPDLALSFMPPPVFPEAPAA
jgi:hypothetical protein